MCCDIKLWITTCIEAGTCSVHLENNIALPDQKSHTTCYKFYVIIVKWQKKQKLMKIAGSRV